MIQIKGKRKIQIREKRKIPNQEEKDDPNQEEKENPNQLEKDGPNQGEKDGPNQGEKENLNHGETDDLNQGEKEAPNQGEKADTSHSCWVQIDFWSCSGSFGCVQGSLWWCQPLSGDTECPAGPSQVAAVSPVLSPQHERAQRGAPVRGAFL